MSCYNNEEEFLSVYTASKLKKGGRPVVTKEELEQARTEFIKSVYCTDNLKESLEKLNFDDLQTIEERFQQKASKNRSWLKPCYVYQGGNLYPTYDFFDFTETKYNEFMSFLIGERYDYITGEPIDYRAVKLNKEYSKTAKKVANYITKVFAKRYIDMEVENGRWPNHMNDIKYVLNKDLGTALELEGTKAYFEKFNRIVFLNMYGLLSERKGNLILSDKKYGNLKWNNFCRVIEGFPTLTKMCSAYYNENQGKFDITIENGVIKCSEQTLTDSDPYGNFSDTYKYEEKSL